MVARQPEVARAPETLADIAHRTGRDITTVRNTWTRHPHWPDAIGHKGRWNLYEPDQIDTWLADHIGRPTPDLEPHRLYTAQQLADAGIGITAATIRADLSRSRSTGTRRWPEPDDTTDGINRWYGATATAALAKRHGYRRNTHC